MTMSASPAGVNLKGARPVQRPAGARGGKETRLAFFAQTLVISFPPILPTNQKEFEMAKGRNQGSQSRNVTERPVRIGARSDVVNPRAVSQVGQSLGNKASTGSGKTVRPVENAYIGRLPAGGPGGVELGNSRALSVGKGGPGAGRNLYGQSGTNKQYGPSNPGVGGLPSTKGQWPD
jgi:hypothetical protein